MSRDVEYYTLLGLDRDCSADDVKKAYKREVSDSQEENMLADGYIET